MKILIAVDGSACTQKALDYLVTHRAMFADGHELALLHVGPALPAAVTRHLDKETVAGFYAEEDAKVTQPARLFLERHGIAVRAVGQRHGNPAEQILEAAGEMGAGLIVMGTHGHGLLGRALMGSVATKVVAEARTAVLLVR